jgi:hypothetical protein
MLNSENKILNYHITKSNPSLQNRRSAGDSYYKPKDTSLTFLWPTGITYRQRKKILDAAHLANPNGSSMNIICWLRQNAWTFAR